MIGTIYAIIILIIAAVAVVVRRCIGGTDSHYRGGTDSHYRGGTDSHYRGGTDSHRTCLFLSDYVDAPGPALDGWNVITKEPYPASCDFVYADGSHIQSCKINRIRATLKCRLNARVLFDKTVLSMALNKIAPDTICKSELVEPGYVLRPGVWMLKANWGWKGKGNRLVTSQAEYDSAMADLATCVKEFTWMKPSNVRIIASEYIRDPMLYDGHKCHLRITVVVLIKGDGAKMAWMKDTAIIVPAPNKYTDSDYTNTAIHDSHLAPGGDGVGIYPEDLPDADPKRVTAMLVTVFDALLPQVDKYPEGLNAYDLFGVDVMLHSDGTPKLIEMNRMPGFYKTIDTQRLNGKMWAHSMFDAVISTAFANVFGINKTPAVGMTLLAQLPPRPSSPSGAQHIVTNKSKK